ncbi:unnamed protein product [Discosporangium mesarthrocarpum]
MWTFTESREAWLARCLGLCGGWFPRGLHETQVWVGGSQVLSRRSYLVPCPSRCHRHPCTGGTGWREGWRCFPSRPTSGVHPYRHVFFVGGHHRSEGARDMQHSFRASTELDIPCCCAVWIALQ